MGNGARLKAVVRRVSMAALFFALVMVAASGVRWRNVRKALEAELVFVFVMVAAKGVNKKGVGKVHKAERISAKLTVAASGARGPNRNFPAVKYRVNVISLREGKRVCVLLIVSWYKITMKVVDYWVDRWWRWWGIRCRKGGFTAVV